MTDTPNTPATDEDEYPKNSIFGNLQAQRKQIADELLLTKQIPHWGPPSGPEIFVVYRPVQVEELDKVRRKAEKNKNLTRAQQGLLAAKDQLILACEKVYGIIEGEKYSFGPEPRGESTRFDAEMAATFGLKNNSARAVVEFLFLNDGDLLSHAEAVAEFSGFGNEQLEDDFAGE